MSKSFLTSLIWSVSRFRLIELLILCLLGSSQNGLSQSNGQQDIISQFDAFRAKAQQKHKQFIDKNDSIFIQFLKTSWKKVSLYNNEFRPTIKPVQQPVSKDTNLNSFELIVDSLEINEVALSANQQMKQIAVDEATSYGAVSFSKQFKFFGVETSLEVRSDLLPRLKEISPESITDFYIGLSKNGDYWKEQLQALQILKTKHQLNDWGFFQLSNTASQVFYGNPHERKLLSWYILLKSGYNVRVGFNDDRLFLIIPTIERLFGVPYFKKGEEVLYLIDEKKISISDLDTYDRQYPGTQKVVSFSMNFFPNLQGEKIHKVLKYKNSTLDFVFDKQVLDFLSTYPQCDLKVYFRPGLSKNNLAIIDQYFNQRIAGKSKRESIDILLEFCQFAFPYATDISQFGKERYLFAEESLFFPSNDCEDRTIFLSFLIRRYLNLHTIALDFPDHVNLGVNLNESISGSFVTYKGLKYLICDPTYINAKSGMLSSVYLNQKVKIINVDQ